MRKPSMIVWLLLAAVLLFGWRRHHMDPTPPAPAATPASAAAAPATPLPAAESAAIPAPSARTERVDRPSSTALPAFLPPEAREVIAHIQSGGPFPYPQDDSIFGNYEGHLPRQPRGWYHEYTVPTPGLSHRGTRRIITGGTPPQAWYYSEDHYDSFRRFDVQGARP